ncbi:MAG: P-type conjugative transfer protein TrbG [Brevundimonas sp.]
MNRLIASTVAAVLAAPLGASGCAHALPQPVAAATLDPTEAVASDPASRIADPPSGQPALSPITPPLQQDAIPETRIEAANAAARIQPNTLDYDQAAQLYAFAPHALYQVYASPGRVTDIVLQPGERLSDQGAIAAGDTARWIIGEAVSGSGQEARTHVLIKPTRPDLATNLILHTDRRTYLMELHARPDVYMASIAWRYPQDEALAAQRTQAERAARENEPKLDLDALNFDYRIAGDAVAWRPERVFDDGRRVIIVFSPEVGQNPLPPLFVRSADGADAALVNYRIDGRRIIVDRLFDRAELRLVEGGRDRVVTLVRLGARR